MYELDTIEGIEHLIMAAHQRFGAVVRELNWHRVMQKQHNSVQIVEVANFKMINPKMVVRKSQTRKSHDQRAKNKS